MTRQYPEWRNDRDAQLHGSLELYTGLIGKVCWRSTSIRFSCSRYSRWCRAHEMGGVNFDPFTPFGTHLPQSVLCFLQQIRVIYGTETDRNAARVFDCVCTSGDKVRREASGGGTEDELECIRGVDRKTGEFRGGVLQGVGNAGETGVVAINVKREQGGSCEIKKGPRQSNRRLSDIAKLEIRFQLEPGSGGSSFERRTSRLGGVGRSIP